MPNIKPLINAFLNGLHTVYDSGKATDELSYYRPLVSRFNGVGVNLSPWLASPTTIAN
jgi:hypothetical protein